MTDYNQIPQYELPEINYGGGEPVVNARKSKGSSPSRGCFLLTPIGCIIMACMGAFACMCLLVVGPIIGLSALVAVLLTNKAQFQGVERIPLESTEVISLDFNDTNAEINITGTSQNEVVVDYVLTVYGFSDGNAQNKLQNTQVMVEKDPNGTINIWVDDAGVDFSFFDLTLNIAVPYQLNTISITNGKAVTIKDVEADMVIESSSDITLSNVSGSFDVEASSFNDIIFTGTVAPSSSNRFNASTGNISVTFQGKVNLQYTANTNTGTLTCPDRSTTTSCSGRYGDGTAQVDIQTTSGNIQVFVRPQ